MLRIFTESNSSTAGSGIIRLKEIVNRLDFLGTIGSSFTSFQSRKQLQNSNVCLSVCLSVRQSVTKTSQPLRIIPISQIPAYKPLCQSAIMPISHHPPLSASQNQNYRPSCLSAIMPIHPSDLCPAFTTFKPFWLVKGAFLIEAKQLQKQAEMA